MHDSHSFTNCKWTISVSVYEYSWMARSQWMTASDAHHELPCRRSLFQKSPIKEMTFLNGSQSVNNCASWVACASTVNEWMTAIHCQNRSHHIHTHTQHAYTHTPNRKLIHTHTQSSVSVNRSHSLSHSWCASWVAVSQVSFPKEPYKREDIPEWLAVSEWLRIMSRRHNSQWLTANHCNPLFDKIWGGYD